MEISLRTHVAMPFNEAVSATRHALAEQGFGFLTEIDVQATMKTKLDKDVGSFLILGACNVEAVDPLAMMNVAADDSLDAVASEAADRIRAALDSLTAA